MPVFPLSPRGATGQRGLNRWGVMSYVTSTAQGLFAGALAIAIVAPDVTVIATGGQAAPPALLGMRQVVRGRTAPVRAGWSASYGVITLDAAAPATLVASPAVVVVTAPDVTVAAPGPPAPHLWGLRQVTRARQWVPRGRATGFGWLPRGPTAVGGTTLTANPAVIVVTAPTATLSAGASLQAAGTQTVVVTAPTATEVSGGVTRAAGTNVVVVTAPAVTVTQATIRTAGTQTVVVSAPTANVAAGAVARAAGTQGVVVTASTAVLSSGLVRSAGTNTVTVSAPTATLRTGVSVQSAGVLTVVLSAPTVRVLGATELPPLDQTFLVSRWTEKPIASRFPDKVLS